MRLYLNVRAGSTTSNFLGVSLRSTLTNAFRQSSTAANKTLKQFRGKIIRYQRRLIVAVHVKSGMPSQPSQPSQVSQVIIFFMTAICSRSSMFHMAGIAGQRFYWTSNNVFATGAQMLAKCNATSSTHCL